MGRPHRAALGGYVYHVLNRANARLTIFDSDGDYQAFEEILAEAVERTETQQLQRAAVNPKQRPSLSIPHSRHLGNSRPVFSRKIFKKIVVKRAAPSAIHR